MQSNLFEERGKLRADIFASSNNSDKKINEKGLTIVGMQASFFFSLGWNVH